MNRHNSEWATIAGILAVIVIAGTQCDRAPTDGCFDADPTQWTEMVCPGE